MAAGPIRHWRIMSTTAISGKLNPDLVARYLNAYHKHGTIWIQRHTQDAYLIMTKFMALRLYVFSGKLAKYTSFPEDWEIARLPSGSKELVWSERGPFTGTWEGWIGSDASAIYPTRYSCEFDSCESRIFSEERDPDEIEASKRRIFMDRSICDILASNFFGLEDFRFEQKDHERPVRVAEASGYCMVAMPLIKNK